ncbi:hypothetical protein M011DRAFT_467280 [Sporormia fimetaria CBS 119925]|uniref:F-box domain-containing protein n=1 Tax=Sporormia fimetaria CBS 119925 TaxID=1340428 RepID=A0A6A6VGC1_9PLEO|nr:hypothetical protein M011DRAFT_467280 [Sporormia fimetaria CBS 119925]
MGDSPYRGSQDTDSQSNGLCPDHPDVHRVPRDRLSTLPDDVILRIVEAVARTSKRDLCNISVLNQRYHRLTDAVLYKSILFDTPEMHLIFSDSLSRRPRRGSTIQEIKLTYPSSELSQLALDTPVHNSHYRPSSFDTLSRTLSVMSNLERLDIAVPEALLHGIGSIFNGPFDLACLKWCSLFYESPENNYWDLRENIHVFAHPTLETLILRRARFDDQGFNILERPHQTSLKKLHLIECDINDDGLADLLEFPIALEEFVMIHSEEPDPPLEETSDNFADYIVALQSQAHSLTCLTIDSPALFSRRALRMREFQVLETLRVSWDHQLFGRTSRKPRLHSVGMPPQLRVLELFSELGTDEEVTDLFVNLIELKDTVARKWERLIVVEGDSYVPRAIKDACRSHNLELQIIGADTDSEAY